MKKSMLKLFLLAFISMLSIGMSAQISSDSMVSMFQLSSEQSAQLKDVRQAFMKSREEITSKPELSFDQREELLKRAQVSAEEKLFAIFNLKQKLLYLDALFKNGALNSSALNMRKTDVLSAALKDTLQLNHDQTTTVYGALKLYLDARSDLLKNAFKDAKLYSKAENSAYQKMLTDASAVLNADQKKRFLILFKRKKGKPNSAKWIA
jgi:hypothetical protein